MEKLWERFETWQRNSTTGMTKDKYLEMMEQLGKQPSEDKCPPGIEDFPDEIIQAIEIFNNLGDRVYPEIGYVGKDYTNLSLLLKVYEIDNIELLYSVLLKLDHAAIKTSQDSLKREYDKIKRKK